MERSWVFSLSGYDADELLFDGENIWIGVSDDGV